MKAFILTVLFAGASSSGQMPDPVIGGPMPANASRSQDSAKVLRIELSIPAPVHDVWEAFTTQQGLSSWLAPDVSVELKPGGDWPVSYTHLHAPHV